MALTDTGVRKAKTRDSAYRMSDSGGLYLWVTPAGGKLWRWKYRYAGEEKLMSLGKYPADSTTKCNGNPGGRWKGWGSILEAPPPSKVCQECATAISSKKNDTKSLPLKMLAGPKRPSPPSWGEMHPASAAS